MALNLLVVGNNSPAMLALMLSLTIPVKEKVKQQSQRKETSSLEKLSLCPLFLQVSTIIK